MPLFICFLFVMYGLFCLYILYCFVWTHGSVINYYYYVCVCVCLYVCVYVRELLLDPWANVLYMLWNKCILHQGVTWLIYHVLNSKVKVTRGHWNYLLFCSNVMAYHSNSFIDSHHTINKSDSNFPTRLCIFISIIIFQNIISQFYGYW